MGHDTIQTPKIDKFASQSLVFRNAYNPTSLCRPNLATMITGKHQHEHAITFNDPVTTIGVLGPVELRGIANQLILEQRPFPELLAETGYSSLQMGKFWERFYRNGGFTEGMTVGNRHGDLGLAIGREGMLPTKDFVQRRKPERLAQMTAIWERKNHQHTNVDRFIGSERATSISNPNR